LSQDTVLRQSPYVFRDAPGRIDDSMLRDAGVLIIGGVGGSFTQAELDAVHRFVERGGGVFAAGLGWSWVTYALDPRFGCVDQKIGQNPKDLSTYPMNRLLAPYGLMWTDRY
jgi:hypothetical protein